MGYSSLDVSTLLGKVMTKVVKSDNNEELYLYTNTGETYRMYHEQDCCESVYIEDVVGNLDDLSGFPLTMAEEVSNEGRNESGTETWTFYKFATTLGYVTIRWYGSSNGYYSESVKITKIQGEQIV